MSSNESSTLITILLILNSGSTVVELVFPLSTEM